MTSAGQDGVPDEGFSSAGLSLQQGSPLPPTRSVINPTKHQHLLSLLPLPFSSLPFALPLYLRIAAASSLPFAPSVCFSSSLPPQQPHSLSVSSHHCPPVLPACLLSVFPLITVFHPTSPSSALFPSPSLHFLSSFILPHLSPALSPHPH